MSFERVEAYDDDERGRVESGRSGPPWKLLFVILIAALAVIFVFQNNDRPEIDLYFWTVETRLWVALLIAMAFGVVLDRLVLWWWRRARRRDRDD